MSEDEKKTCKRVSKNALAANNSAQRIDKEIDQKIRHRRISMRISQNSVAEIIGLAFQQLQKYENAQNRMYAGRLKLIADALDVPVGYLFDERPDQEIRVITQQYLVTVDTDIATIEDLIEDVTGQLGPLANDLRALREELQTLCLDGQPEENNDFLTR